MLQNVQDESPAILELHLHRKLLHTDSDYETHILMADSTVTEYLPVILFFLFFIHLPSVLLFDSAERNVAHKFAFEYYEYDKYRQRKHHARRYS